MSKPCLSLLFGAIGALAILGLAVSPSHAIPPFEKEFKEMYYKPDSSDANEKELAKALDGLGTKMCNTCHVGTKKKDRNAYGFELDKLLDKTADKADTAKIRKALEDVAAMKSNPKDPASPTFGELMKQGKLPSDEVVVKAPN